MCIWKLPMTEFWHFVRMLIYLNPGPIKWQFSHRLQLLDQYSPSSKFQLEPGCLLWSQSLCFADFSDKSQFEQKLTKEKKFANAIDWSSIDQSSQLMLYMIRMRICFFEHYSGFINIIWLTSSIELVFSIYFTYNTRRHIEKIKSKSILYYIK